MHKMNADTDNAHKTSFNGTPRRLSQYQIKQKFPLWLYSQNEKKKKDKCKGSQNYTFNQGQGL